MIYLISTDGGQAHYRRGPSDLPILQPGRTSHMKIAVTSQNFRTVTGHAGRATRFLVYDVQLGADPVEVARLDLPPEQSFHEFGGKGPHPIDGVDVLLSSGFAGHFARLMADRAIGLAATEKDDPVEAVRDYLVRRQSGTELPVITSCDCGGGCHDHEEPAGAAAA
jgi:predicted Fe-Mo cluster-binding NifX family protein